MPIILPLEIQYTAIATQGNIIGIKKVLYTPPQFTTLPLAPIALLFTEQVLIGDSMMSSESPSKAETVIITNT